MENHLSGLEQLNRAIAEGHFAELVQADEARQIARIKRIAERIAARVPAVRLVLLAGPSSAGKTTTALRLCRRLEENGLAALPLSTDNYFVDHGFTPRDANGELDYEHVKCVDDARLVADLGALFAGAPVRLRKFDFLEKTGYDADASTTLPPRGVVVLEGIHALNPDLTPGIPENVKFRVYLNLFTQLTEDSCEVFFADDVRLVRRIVRDAHYRDESAAATIRRWPSVLAGEAKWINPHRGLADAVFNTALDYETAVLKPFALRQLEAVDPADAVAAPVARRLAGFLAGVTAAPADAVPGNSILRETIGGSILKYD